MSFSHLSPPLTLRRYGGGGYAPPGAEAVARSSEQPNAPPDAVESLVFSNGSAPPNTKLPPDFQLAVSDYSDAMKGLLSVLMQVSEASLGLETGFFETFYKGAPNFLRLAYYAPDRARTAEGEGGGGAEAAGGAAAGEAGGEAGGAAGAANVAAPAAGHSEQQRYGAHTDYQGFTILSQDAAGLQVRMTDDDGGSARWVGVEPVQGALIINAGDLLQHWTNGVWISNVHRVVKAPGAFERLSLVCFTGPRDDATIVPLPQCVAEKGGKATYAPILAGEHLKAKLAKTSLL